MTHTRAPRTLAQWYCLLVGATLLLVGMLGFLADASFDTEAPAENGTLLGFEVNGWHNLVHLVSGLLLLASANTRPTAKTMAIGFGFVYGLVALWGLIDGESVLSVVPVNGADNVLHLLLSGLGIATGLRSPTTKREQLRRHGGDVGPAGRDHDATAATEATEPPAVRRDAAAGTGDAGRFGEDSKLPEENKITRTRS